MILLQANRIRKSFGANMVLDGASLTIDEGERLGLIGPNGSGKSTLLECITTTTFPDSGEITVAFGRSIGYMQQLPAIDVDRTAWDAVMDGYVDLMSMREEMDRLTQAISEASEELQNQMDRYAQVCEKYELGNGYACEANVRRIMTGLGFSPHQYQQKWSSFSGGEKTRLNLARLLTMKPDILLLDEPTNHLDITSVEWLEGYLSSYRGSMLVVSHDRRFLDRIATRVVDLRNGALHSYPGNYSAYLKQRSQEDLAMSRAYDRQQEYIRRTEEFIRRYQAGQKSKQARGRKSQLERLDRIQSVPKTRSISLSGSNLGHESGDIVMSAQGISKSFGGHPLFSGINFRLYNGERLALVGPNGIGKTTLLKILLGEILPDEGEVRLGSRVKIGYLSQERLDLNPANTLLDELMNGYKLTLETARGQLGRMGFSGDHVFKRVGDLSGGEQSRLAILKLLLGGGNFLILDEPTNHLDIDGCQAIEDLLQEYQGTLLVVSHDRFFLDQVVTEVVAIEENLLVRYQGNYSYYQIKAAENDQIKPKSVTENHKRQQRDLAKEMDRDTRRRARQQQMLIDGLEERISGLELRKVEIEMLFADSQTYADEMVAKSNQQEYNLVTQSLGELYDEWETLMANNQQKDPPD